MRATRRRAIAVVMLVVLLVACEPNEGRRQSGAVQSEAQSGQPVAKQAPAAPSPTLTLPTEAVRQDGELSLQATGFAPAESLVISANDSASGRLREVARLSADHDGQLKKQKLILPAWLTSGTHQVVAAGKRSNRQAKATLYVRAKERWAKPDSYVHKPAERIGFIAGGFVPGEQVQVFFDADERKPVAQIMTDQAGNTAWSEVIIPILQPGKHTLRLVGKEGAIEQSITIQPFQPSLELSPWSGPPGRTVDLNARGFVPDEKVRIYIGGDSQPILTLQADQWGNFWGAGPITIPADRGGEKVSISAVGERSQARAEAAFGVYHNKPWGELSNYAGLPGTSVIFSGGGFAAREQVIIHVGNRGTPPVAVGQTDENGRFWGAGPATVPADAENGVTFVFVGQRSGAEATATFKVLALPVPEMPRP